MKLQQFSASVHGPCRVLLALVLAPMLAQLLGGCARVNDTGLRLVSTKVDAYLHVNGQWLSGEVLLAPDRTGRAVFAAPDAPDTADKAGAATPATSQVVSVAASGTTVAALRACSGSLRYTATYTAEMDLHCNDGTQLALQTTLLSETRGYGYGSTAQGPASVAFGLPEDQAYAFMGRAAPAAPAPTP